MKNEASDTQTGVYISHKADGSVYYRSSIQYAKRHISLGSYSNEIHAALAFQDAKAIYSNYEITLLNYKSYIKVLPFDKVVTLLNHRDNNIYIKTPIYLNSGYFSYFLNENTELKFDNDDLFYYSTHRILSRKGHLYVNDYGMQYNIRDRYGIQSFSVVGRDYTFANGDENDLRYSNVIVINHYHGVQRIDDGNRNYRYEVKIHLNGNFLIGRFKSEAKAAVAYNKAVDYARDHGYQKNFIENYVQEFTAKQYADMYLSIRLPDKYMRYIDNLTS